MNEMLAQMLISMQKTFKSDWKEVGENAKLFIQYKKDRLEWLAYRRLNEIIGNDFFLDRIAAEKYILSSELHVIAFIDKELAEDAANAAFKVFEEAVAVIAEF